MNDEIKEIKHTLQLLHAECNPKAREEDINYTLDYITNLQEKLEVSQTNEETYRLEMQDITKILGLDECTLFDEVKKYATNLQQENERLNEILVWKQEHEKELHTKIEKAIEYIEKHFEDDEGIICKITGKMECEINYNFLDDLLNILQNGSDTIE